MRYLFIIAILLFPTYSIGKMSLEEKHEYWGIEYEVSYNDGLWIKMGCVKVVLKSNMIVDGTDFIGIEAWELINRGEEDAGYSKFFLQYKESQGAGVTSACFAPSALENIIFYFHYKPKKDSAPGGNIPLIGKEVATASNKLLKENGRLQEGDP